MKIHYRLSVFWFIYFQKNKTEQEKGNYKTPVSLLLVDNLRSHGRSPSVADDSPVAWQAGGRAAAVALRGRRAPGYTEKSFFCVRVRN